MSGQSGQEETLKQLANVRLVDNITLEGRLIEVFRGGEEIERVLEEIKQVTHHVFIPGKIGGNHYHLKKQR